MNVDDECGNDADACTVTFSYKDDTTAPVFDNCPTAPIPLGCHAEPTVDDVLELVLTATDNCDGPISVVAEDITPGTPSAGTAPCTFTKSFTVNVDDECGNDADACTVTFSYKDDTTAPVLITARRHPFLWAATLSLP